MQNIGTCLWFDNQAEEAAEYYSTVFKRTKVGRVARYGEAGAKVSGQKAGTVMTVDFELEGLKITGLNGGPMFKFTPALSFFVSCDNQEEITEKWKKLSAGGKVRMALDKYPWAEQYAWTADKFGVEWQLILSPRKEKIVPAFLFVDKLFGKGEEAINFYRSLFKNSEIETMVRDEKTKSVMHSWFTLNGQSFVLMEGQGEHGYTFSLATSFVVNCDTQAEIDTYWETLSAGGEKSQCGWLTDKYGVAWQIVPAAMDQWMSTPSKAEKVMSAMLTMKKLDMATLKAAAEG